jgi:hypothetical protein
MQRVSPENVLHVAVCQAVGLMNGALVFAQSEEGQQVRNILRTALTEYADAYMDQPVTESERAAMIRGHANSAVDIQAVREVIAYLRDFADHDSADQLARAIGDEK